MNQILTFLWACLYPAQTAINRRLGAHTKSATFGAMGSFFWGSILLIVASGSSHLFVNALCTLT